jgi:hypothetical protein
MAINNSVLEKANAFDKNGLTKREIDNALLVLKEFRIKFAFAENPKSIDWLEPDKIFKSDTGDVGEFFRYLVYHLDPLGHLTIQSSNVYRNIRVQIDDFKYLLRVAVDKKRSLAEKVNAPWEKINGLGQDKEIAKKIVFCFNYESGKVLPIFRTAHLKFFVNKLIDKPNNPRKYYSLGEEYAELTSELLLAKEKLPITKAWEFTYFTRFLYYAYPPPDRESAPSDSPREKTNIKTETNEQLELRAFIKLLGELQSKGKITGQQFRENRELWMQQQPNDRDVLTWRLKQLLTTEAKTNLDSSKSQPYQKHRKM